MASALPVSVGLTRFHPSLGLRSVNTRQLLAIDACIWLSHGEDLRSTSSRALKSKANCCQQRYESRERIIRSRAQILLVPFRFLLLETVIIFTSPIAVAGEPLWRLPGFVSFLHPDRLMCLPLSTSSAPRWVDTQKSTETRQSTLADYCHSLINLPPHISRCKQLTSFFKVRPKDENPSAPSTSVCRTHTHIYAHTHSSFHMLDAQENVGLKVEGSDKVNEC